MTSFKLACYCVLMEHHGRGVVEAHPEYLAEKWEVFCQTDDFGAWSLLDGGNQSKVMDWCVKWNVMPPIKLQ